MTKLILTTFLTTLALAGCGSDDKSSAKADAQTIREGDAAVDAAAAPDCFSGTPTTNDQLINACPPSGTTRIFKTVHLPLLNSDGTVPPLP